MGNKICSLDCIKREKEEEKEITELTKYGECTFCKKAEICTLYEGGAYGTNQIMICIECEIDLNRRLLYN